jgi:signal transduction histidine kinase
VDIKLSHVKTDVGMLVVVFMRDMTERIQKDVALREAQAQVVEQQRTLAKVEERQHMARDMHDSVNQSIHSLAMFSETLIVLLRKQRVQDAETVAERIQEGVQQALKEIRLLLYKAQSPLADQNMDLIEALEERLNMVERRVSIRADIVHRHNALARCPAAWTENLYWITMEALNNTLKHAQARSVTITLEEAEGYLCLNIADNGAGFDSQRTQAGGFGLRSMRERAALLGGILAVTSELGSGTRVEFKAKMET